MRFDEACIPAFARHETFHPRYGWPKKAVDAVDQNGLAGDLMAAHDLFADEELAVVKLGVGKNMVRSVRFWGIAYKLLSSTKVEGRRVARTAPTRMGSFLFSREGGVDQYAEDMGTSWLLHWRLLAPPCSVPVWWVAFNEMRSIEFTEEQLDEIIMDRVRDVGGTASSVKKDLSCMMRMYIGGEKARTVFDDQIDCPSRELSLLGSGANLGSIRFQIGPKPTLPALVLLFCCLDFLARTDATAQTVTLSRLQLDTGSPGAAFKLDDESFQLLLEAAVGAVDGVSLTVAAGVPQLALSDNPATVGTRSLLAHYRCNDNGFLARLLCGPDGDLTEAADLLDAPA